MMRKNKFLKHLFVLVFIISAAIPTGGFNIKKEPSDVYYDFGTFTYPRADIPNTKTSFSLWITREYVSVRTNQKSFVSYKYHYKLVGLSQSQYINQSRNTFIEGFQVYYNQSNQPLNSYPLNFYVKKQPTVLYEIKSNDERPSFFIKWTRSYYDARQ